MQPTRPKRPPPTAAGSTDRRQRDEPGDVPVVRDRRPVGRRVPRRERRHRGLVAMGGLTVLAIVFSALLTAEYLTWRGPSTSGSTPSGCSCRCWARRCRTTPGSCPTSKSPNGGTTDGRRRNRSTTDASRNRHSSRRPRAVRRLPRRTTTGSPSTRASTGRSGRTRAPNSNGATTRRSSRRSGDNGGRKPRRPRRGAHAGVRHTKYRGPVYEDGIPSSTTLASGSRRTASPRANSSPSSRAASGDRGRPDAARALRGVGVRRRGA